MEYILGLNGLDRFSDLLFQILMVIFPIFVYQMVWVEKKGLDDSVKGKTVSIIFYGLTISLCMMFPIHYNPEHRFDLRMIPLTIGFLHLGQRAGMLLTIWQLLFRIILGGLFGVLHAIFLTVLYIPALITATKSYQNLNRTKRIKLYLLLNLYFYVCYIVSSVADNFILLSAHAISVFISFALVSFTTSIVVIYFVESMQENLRLKAELQQSEKMRLISDLSGVFAHEIRNPMQVTRGFLQLLNEPDLPDSKKGYIQISIEELDRANMIINDFLTFAKPTTEDNQKVDVKSQLLRVINIIQTFSISQNVTIRTHLVEGCWVAANSQRLNQCFINIIKNAIESMPNGGEIQVRCYPTNDGYIQITIEDQGMGMTKEQINKLGTPFYSLKKDGTGIGMMVTLQIIKSYHGKLNIDSELGKGTSFSILLPQLDVVSSNDSGTTKLFNGTGTITDVDATKLT